MGVIAPMSNTKIGKDFKETYKRWEASGLSRMEFCKKEDFKYSWFMYHQKRMRGKKKMGGFDKVELKTETKTTSAEIEFHYPDGRFFVFGVGTPVSFIVEIMG